MPTPYDPDFYDSCVVARTIGNQAAVEEAISRANKLINARPSLVETLFEVKSQAKPLTKAV